MSFDFNKEQNFCIIKMAGLLTSEQIFHAFDAAVSHIEYQKGMARIWDFRKADLSLVNTDSIMSMAQYSLAFPEGVNDVNVAFVVKRDLELELVNKFKSFASKAKTPIQIFKSIEDALTWAAA
jgi:hypothetical protein